MKTFATALTGVAFASLLTGSEPARAENAQSWNGPWAGGFIGAAQTNYRYPQLQGLFLPVALTKHEWSGSLTALVGWNFRYGSVVLGPVVSATHTVGGIKGPSITGRSSRTSLAAGARLGYLLTENLLLYGTGGLTIQNHSLSAYVATIFEVREHLLKDGARIGAYIGAGAEYSLGSNWSAILEYRYTDYGTIRVRGPITIPLTMGSITLGPSFTMFHSPYSHMVQVGVAYRW